MTIFFCVTLYVVIRGVQRSDGARGENFIVWPLPNSSIEECDKYRHSKNTCPDLCHVKKDYATKIYLKWELKWQRRVSYHFAQQ